MPNADSTVPERSFSCLGTTVISFLVLAIVGFLVVGNLGAPRSKTPFGPEGADAGPEGPYNQVANRFLIDLREGRIDAAYAHTSKEFQEKLPFAEFQAMVKSHPFPGSPGTVNMGRREDNDRNVWVYHFHQKGPERQLKFSLDVGKEGDHFQVTRFTID